MDKLIELLNARRKSWAKIAVKAGVAWTTLARTARGESIPSAITAERLRLACRRVKEDR